MTRQEPTPGPLNEVDLDTLFYDLWGMATEEARTGKRLDADLSYGRFQREVVEPRDRLLARIALLDRVAAAAERFRQAFSDANGPQARELDTALLALRTAEGPHGASDAR